MCLNDHHINELDPVCDGDDECCPVDSDSVLEFHEAESNSDFALQTARGSENGDDCMNCPLRRENSILKSERAYWRKMHQKAVERENRMKGERAELEAKLKLREKQLYGRKSEKSSGKSETERPDGEKRPGGRQRESRGRGRGRRDYSHLEAETEGLCLPENERTCSICGLPFEEFKGIWLYPLGRNFKQVLLSK